MNDLPLPPQSSEPLPRPSQAGRIALGLLCLVTFVVFFRHFSALNRAGDAIDLHPSWVPLAIVEGGAFVTFFVLWVVRANRSAAAYNRAISEMSSGKDSDALRQFEMAARRSDGAQHAIGLFYMGACHLNLGDVHRALELFAAAERSGKSRAIPYAHETLPNLIATCYALRGETAIARRWLAEGRRRVGARTSPLALLPEAVVACREGRPDEAVKATTERMAEVEGGMARYARLVRLVRAFSLHAADNGSEPEVLETIAGLKPVRESEVALLSGSWPEMQAFIERRRLSETKAAA
ncbi:MAG: hypothetical protein WBV82_06795 [Myxococcaceae bacterium]